MKKMLIVIQFVLLIVFSSSSYAMEGQGKIVEIKACGSGVAATGWVNYIFVKLSDDQWFGIQGNHGTGDYDSNFYHSLMLTAFAMQLDVSVKATYVERTACGMTVSVLWNKATDYLRIVRDE